MPRHASLLPLCLLLAVAAPRTSAQTAQTAQPVDYQPSNHLTPGPELVAVYIGASDCEACNFPQVKSAVRAMKPLLAAQAKQHGMTMSIIGVAQDWDLNKGAAFLEPLGAFDQIAIGGNWTNIAVEQFILRDASAQMAMPQIVVLERTVNMADRVTVSQPRILKRILGYVDIPAWVAAGAPVAGLESKPPR